MSRGYNSHEDMDDEEITLESASIMTAVMLQSGLTYDELNHLLENCRDELDHMLDEEVLTERTIVKLDKKAVFNRNFMAALFTIAREKKDRDFKKLVTLWKMENILTEKLLKKYTGEAKRRAGQMAKNVGKSRSSTLVKASNVSRASAAISGKLPKASSQGSKVLNPKIPELKRIK